MLDPSTFVFGIIGEGTSMMIQIEDTTKFENYMLALGATEDDQKKALTRIYGEAIDTSKDYREIILPAFVALASQMGLKVVVSDNHPVTNKREWYIFSDNEGNTVKINCL